MRSKQIKSVSIVLVLINLLTAGCATSTTPAPVFDLDTTPDLVREPQTTFTGRTAIVKVGDNLYSIAFEAGFRTQDVARWNNLQEEDTIVVGQEIKLYPPPGDQPDRSTSKTYTPSAIRSEGSTPARTSSNSPTKWIWPVQGEIISTFSSKQKRNGIEIANAIGTPVSAAAQGRVVYAGTGLIGFGRIIIVKHNDQFLSVYAHNSKVIVNEGDSVSQGQKIAEMGSSDTDRVKLHFEIRKDGKPVNPLQYLPKA